MYAAISCTEYYSLVPRPEEEKELSFSHLSMRLIKQVFTSGRIIMTPSWHRCILLNFGFLSSISKWILKNPPIHQYHPLLQCQIGLCKECPVPKSCWHHAGSVTTSPPVTNAYLYHIVFYWIIADTPILVSHCGFACSLIDYM